MSDYVWILVAVALTLPNSKQGWVALDQWINTRFGGFADETISARAYRNRLGKRHWRIAHRAIDTIFFWQTEHCMQSYISEIRRKQLPPDYQSTKEQ